MRALVIGDVGVQGGMVHIGDEAMFDVATAQLRARGVEVTGVSSNPGESAARYGIGAVAPLGFAGLSRAASVERARMLMAAAADGSLPADDPAAGAIGALRDGAALVVAGGGNLASRWPMHIVERTTLAAIASGLGRPVVVSGQTLGPDLVDDDARLVAGMLRDAALTGVREPTSAALAASWGLVPRLGVDDASFLGDGASSTAVGDHDGVLVSLSGWFGGLDPDATEAAIARLVDRAAALVGGPVRFHAHFGPVDAAAEPRGDAALHERIRSRLRTPSVVVPTGDSAGAAALARSAALLITSRYHPAVFAAPAGVPVLGLVADDYTRIKLTGVLGHWSGDGVGSATVGLADLDGGGAAAISTLVADAPRISAAAAARRPAHLAEFTAWWDAVARVVAG